jgi:tryptophan halogenase
MAIMRMIALFPTDGIADGDRAEFNRAVDYEYDRVRDFLVLHYRATTRDDSPFWNDMRTMAVPDSLTGKIELFRRAGRVERYSSGLFLEPSWVAVYLGQGIVPERWDQRADAVEPRQLAAAMNALRGRIREAVATMPEHREALPR